MIYSVTVKRMQVWTYRIRADDAEAAREIANDFADEDPPNDDYGYETSAVPSRDQKRRSDDEERL